MDKNIKTVITYTAMSVFAFVTDKIYSIFSHGVGSNAMSSMWIWLICLGAVFYLLLEIICKKAKKTTNRLFSNIYNSGLAVFVVGMLLQGIVEIAGTSSGFILFYKAAGILLMVIGACFLYITIIMDWRIIYERKKQ